MTYLSLSLLFSSAGHVNSKQQNENHIPTYISISPRKDGTTAKVKCLNPQRSTSNSTLLPLKRKLKVSSSNISAILPKFRVQGSSHHRRPSSLYSTNSSNSNLQNDITRSSTYIIVIMFV
jgi:F-box and WD-40 domain protein 1/11